MREQKSAQQPQEGVGARRALLELLRLVQVPQGTREVAGDADYRRQVAERCGLVILLGAGAVLGLDLPEQLERLIEPALHRQHSSEAAPRSEGQLRGPGLCQIPPDLALVQLDRGGRVPRRTAALRRRLL